MYKRSAIVIKHVNMTIKLIFERYKAIKNIPMLRNLVLKLSIFLQNHILINLVLKLSNNYIKTNITINQVYNRFILILERYKIIKSISEEEKSVPQIIKFSPISQYITLFGNSSWNYQISAHITIYRTIVSQSIIYIAILFIGYWNLFNCYLFQPLCTLVFVVYWWEILYKHLMVSPPHVRTISI